MKNLLVLLAAMLILGSCIQEIKMQHRQRNAHETKMFIEYMNNGPHMQNVMKTLQSLFPHKELPNVYTYPEVKIYNYLDAQYYGYSLILYLLVKSESEHPSKTSVSSLILDLLTFGFLVKNADSLLHAIFIICLMPLRAHHMIRMAPSSTLLMDLEELSDSLVRILSPWQDFKPRTHSLDRLLN